MNTVWILKVYHERPEHCPDPVQCVFANKEDAVKLVKQEWESDVQLYKDKASGRFELNEEEDKVYYEIYVVRPGKRVVCAKAYGAYRYNVE